LEDWIFSQETMDLPLDEIEREQEKRGREVMRLMLQAHIQARGVGDIGPAIEVLPSKEEEEPIRLTHRRDHERHEETIFGGVKVHRLGYGLPGQASVHPLDESLVLPERSYSYELQRRLVKAEVQGPFDEAVERVQESTGVLVPKRSAEEIAKEAAEDFDTFYQERTPPPAAQCGPILVGAVDCKGIPMVKPEPAERPVRRGRGEKANKKRMSTVATTFTMEPRIRTPEEVVESLFQPELKVVGERKPPRPRPEHKRVWASLQKGKEAVIQELAQEMDRRDPDGKKTRVAVTDGERALQIRVARMLGPCLVLVLDLLHVLEKLWKAAYVFHPEGSQEAEDWVRERSLRILRGEVSQVVKGLRQSVTKRGMRGERRKTLLGVAGYFYRNRKRMRYDEYLAKGLPIASGAVEGACKNLVKDRMERSGMRWTEESAEAMLKLRATYLSDDFEEYWAFHVRRDQERLHPAGHWRPSKVVDGK